MSRARRTVEELYFIAIKYARKHGYPDVANDFASFLALKLLEGKSQNQTFRFAFTDFLRDEFGGFGSHAGEDALLRSHREHEATSLDGETREERMDRIK